MPSKQELLNKCKELNLKGITGKNKDELIKILELKGIIFEADILFIKPENVKQQENPLNQYMYDLMNELCSLIKKDMKRKVCPNCHELGHDKASNTCIINIKLDNINREKIKQYIILNPECDDSQISEVLGINITKYKTLYNSIPLNEILESQEITEEYFDKVLNYSRYNCSLCNKIQYNSNISSREWKETKNVCDICWIQFESDRDVLWKQIMDYFIINKCNICNIEKTHKSQRFHYDHINMFNKESSIYEMVNRGDDINLIIHELNKCQLVCISCHSIITHMERKFIFTKIKINLNKQLKRNTITEEQYNLKCDEYNILYKNKMSYVYEMLRSKK
jgi:hypothetical protein